MTRLALAYVLLLGLSACGDPLEGIGRVSEGAVLPAEPGTRALPTEEELAREGSILAELFAPQAHAETRVDDEQRAGTPDQVPTQPEDTDTLASAQVVGAHDGALATEAPRISDAKTGAPAPRARGGVLAWLRQAAQPDDAADAQTALPAPAIEDEAETTVAALPVSASPDLVEPEKRRGLFGAPRAETRNGPDAVDVAPGMSVPFGQIARNCTAKPAGLGKVVDKAARKGRGYVLYDTAPESTQPRTFYVTGFADNCPRQFTAALALFGDPAFHEQLRYGLPAEEYPYSTTDEAYEKLKRKVCNVGRNTPCGDRIDRLSRNTTFISAYEKFTDNGRWADMLLHDGSVLAAALKAP
ncbi:hypothetical protein [uncultured Tateyamaria sp.]|uniref:hypothetical protein n=1 Tax=uncultured Tateyamaria sp. TaxID=455651 RepID=UPI00262E7B62|nr:hypothetical protein [uncultured Tateyamaria sp.]